MQKLIKIFLFVSLVGFSLLSVSCNSEKKINPVAEKGVLDLRGWDFEKDGNIALNGEWRFYWKELVNPNDTIVKFPAKETFILVPGLWRNVELEGELYSSQGYATYSLEILLDSTNQWLKLHTKDAIATSSMIYANGEEVGSNGVVGNDEKITVPSDHIELFSFLPNRRKIKIVIHVSSATKGFSGGIFRELKLGLIHNIHKEKNTILITNIFIYGGIFIFMISQLFFYFALSHDKSFLYLSITSFLILLYFSIDITREIAAYNFKLNHILLNIGWIFSLPAFIYYLKSIFKGLVNKFIPMGSLLLAFITIIIYLAGSTIDFYRVSAIIELLYILIISLVAFYKKIEHSKRLLAGLSILVLAAINDLLLDLIVIQSTEMIHFGIFIFLFIQVYAVSSNFTKAYRKNRKLSKELFSINRNLENLVIERTKKIEAQNIQLTNLNETKDRFFSIIAHDLKSPISSMLSILDLFSAHRDRFDEKSTELLIEDIHKSTGRTYNLLENLLNWAQSQRGEIQYKPTNFELYSLLNANIELMTLPFEKKQIKLTKKTKQKLLCFADKSMIDLVIRNLLSNAIKFTPVGGEISINHKEQGSMISVTIKDSGIGIKKENLRKLFDSGVKFTTWGTDDEKGSGLGLILCKEFIEKNKGTLKVESIEGKGSSFIFSIPKGNSN